jgi:hypothetical protein
MMAPAAHDLRDCLSTSRALHRLGSLAVLRQTCLHTTHGSDTLRYTAFSFYVVDCCLSSGRLVYGLGIVQEN